jgi:hypothetical protein
VPGWSSPDLPFGYPKGRDRQPKFCSFSRSERPGARPAGEMAAQSLLFDPTESYQRFLPVSDGSIVCILAMETINQNTALTDY